MATIQTRPGRKGVYVYYFDVSSGKQVQLPRTMTAHLDGLPIEKQTAWVEKWEKDHGICRERSNRMHLREDDSLNSIWKNYQSWWEGSMKEERREVTRDGENDCWEIRILPFFVGKHHKKDPRDWHQHVPAFHMELFGSGLAKTTIQKTLHALERLGKYLVFSQVMTFPYAIQAPKVKVAKITPLKVKLSPDDVIDFATHGIPKEWSKLEGEKDSRERISPDEVRLAILLSYFAGLAPSEMTALSRDDFLTGEEAESLCKTLVSFRDAGLGTKLAVSIDKTMPSVGLKAVALTKNDYRRAVVNIWHKDAAKLIGALLAKRDRGRLIPLSKSGMFQCWASKVLPKIGATLHDMRRSSCLYLGRTVRLPPTLIQEHMRHANLSTTLLYMREPATPESNRKRKQDFSDIL